MGEHKAKKRKKVCKQRIRHKRVADVFMDERYAQYSGMEVRANLSKFKASNH